MKFAEGTTVPVEKSRAEIERLLTRYGAERFASGWDQAGAVIFFDYKNRRVRFVLPLPTQTVVRGKEPRGWFRMSAQQREKYLRDRTDAEMRRRWRALLLTIKAKLEAVTNEITSFDEEFLAHFVLPSGQTFAEWAVPYLQSASEAMPPLLPGRNGG